MSRQYPTPTAQSRDSSSARSARSRPMTAPATAPPDTLERGAADRTCGRTGRRRPDRRAPPAHRRPRTRARSPDRAERVKDSARRGLQRRAGDRHATSSDELGLNREKGEETSARCSTASPTPPGFRPGGARRRRETRLSRSQRASPASGPAMSKLHLVFGGRVKDPRGLDFDLDTHRPRRHLRQLCRCRGRLARRGPAHGRRCRDEICRRPPAPAARAGGRRQHAHLSRRRARPCGIARAAAAAAAAVRRRSRRYAPASRAESPARRQASPSSAEARPRRPAARATLSQRLSAAMRTICFGRPKLSAKAPITALIAPLAPIIGIGRAGSTSHCAIAAA